MRFANDFEVGTNTFAVVSHVTDRVLMISIHVDVEDDLLEDFELLPIFVHPHHLLQDVLRNDLRAELACDYRRTQMRDEFVFKLFLGEELIDLSKEVFCLGDLQTKLDGNFDRDLVDREVILVRLITVVMS